MCLPVIDINGTGPRDERQWLWRIPCLPVDEEVEEM